MATTYAAYANVMYADKAQRASLASSRRTSDSSNSSSSKKSKFSFKAALDQLRPTTEPVKVDGVYSPIIKRGPLFSNLRTTHELEGPVPFYQRERPLFSAGKKTNVKADAVAVN